MNMSKRLDAIYKRGLRSLDDFYEAKPVRTITSLIRGDKDPEEETPVTSPVDAGEPVQPKEHPWRRGFSKNANKVPEKVMPKKLSSKRKKK